MEILDRQQLAQFLTNPKAIRAFEELFLNAVELTPSTLQDVNISAGEAQRQAGEALAGLAAIAELLSTVLLQPVKEFIPVDTYEPPIVTFREDFYQPASVTVSEDFYLPALSLGTMSNQNADRVNITGGAMLGTYSSSDGSAGITTTVTTGSLVGKTITIKDGLITDFS